MEYPYKGLKRAVLSLLFSGMALMAAVDGQADTVTQTPLFLGPAEVPGNLAIAMSVEYPTVDSLANLGDYSQSEDYLGYFDPNKCYAYIYDSDETERHFQPTSSASNHACPGNSWSGNFLNWAGMSTIDPFRWALTGGYRVRDTTSETWLQGARITNQEDNNGNVSFMRTVSNANVIANATPFDADEISIGLATNSSHNLRFSFPQGGRMSDGSAIRSSGQAYLDTSFDQSWSLSNEGATLHSASGNIGGGWSYQWGQDLGISNGYLNKQGSIDVSQDYLALNQAVDLTNNSSLIFSGSFNMNSNSTPQVYITNSTSWNGRVGFGLEYSGNRIRLVSVNGHSTTTLAYSNYALQSNRTYKFILSVSDQGMVSLRVTYNDDSPIADLSHNAGVPTSQYGYIFIQGSGTYSLDDFNVRLSSEAVDNSSSIYESTGNNQYEASRTVAVCLPSMLEGNCVGYNGNYKPEGLLQEYANQVRYSVFGYLNDSSTTSWGGHYAARDGGVLRARQSFIGQRLRDPDEGWSDNPNPEWDNDTGILETNPAPDDANATNSFYGTNINHSGVINYINGFGELNDNNYKTLDPVSELYYAVTRYFRGLETPTNYYSLDGGGRHSHVEVRLLLNGLMVSRLFVTGLMARIPFSMLARRMSFLVSVIPIPVPIQTCRELLAEAYLLEKLFQKIRISM